MYIKSKSSQHEQISRKNSIASGSAKGWELRRTLALTFLSTCSHPHWFKARVYVCKSISLTFYKKRPSRNLEYREEEKTRHERTRETLSAHTPEIKEFCFILYCIDARALCYICCLGGCHSHSLCQHFAALCLLYFGHTNLLGVIKESCPRKIERAHAEHQRRTKDEADRTSRSTSTDKAPSKIKRAQPPFGLALRQNNNWQRASSKTLGLALGFWLTRESLLEIKFAVCASSARAPVRG